MSKAFMQVALVATLVAAEWTKEEVDAFAGEEKCKLIGEGLVNPDNLCLAAKDFTRTCAAAVKKGDEECGESCDFLMQFGLLFDTFEADGNHPGNWNYRRRDDDLYKNYQSLCLNPEGGEDGESADSTDPVSLATAPGS